jgi:hypothetical protein
LKHDRLEAERRTGADEEKKPKKPAAKSMMEELRKTVESLE